MKVTTKIYVSVGVIAERAQRKLTLLILQIRKQAPESLSNLPKDENKLEAEAGIEPFNLLCYFALMFSYHTLSPV